MEEIFDYHFNPSKIDISTHQISLHYLLTMLKNDEIDLFPEYQRNWNLWNVEKQSRLIESLLIKIPIPAFYFDSDKDGFWQVVDGLQRVTTFFNFIIKENFTLKGMEFLPQLNGLRYSELPRDLQRRLEEFPLSIYLIKNGTPEDIKFIIFSRINTGGVNLNNQELRYALNQGIATTLLSELAKSDEFLKATDYSVGSKRMMDLELVNRFLAFSIISEDYNGNLDTFMTKALHIINTDDHINIENLKDSFLKAMKFSSLLFGKNAFRKYEFGKYNKRINRSIFDCVSTGLAHYSEANLYELLNNKNRFVDEYENLFYDNIFSDSISFTTNTKQKISYRFQTIHNLIKKHIE